MNDQPSTSTGQGASPPEKVSARPHLLLDKFPQEQRVQSGEQMLLATMDIFGVLVAKLVGLGIIQAQSLRIDLVGQAEIARKEHGHLIRAGMIENVADNLQLVID